MSFATSTQTKIADFLKKLESGGSAAAKSFASISAMQGPAAFGTDVQTRPFAKTEAIFRQGLLLGIQGNESVIDKAPNVAPELVGVLCEGSAMGLAMLDLSTPWQKKDRWRRFAEGEGACHIYEVYVGLGLAIAQMGQTPEHKVESLESVYKWLVIDGYGFHEGVFQTQKYIKDKHSPPKQLHSHHYASRAFDQGLGRSLWFVHNASPNSIASSINGFSPERQPDLWSGIGIAASHAGGIARDDLKNLKKLSTAHLPWLAQGAAFAAKIREHAGTQADHTEMACWEICGMSAVQAAELTDKAHNSLPSTEHEPAYESWRMKISNNFR